jgi:putative transposase
MTPREGSAGLADVTAVMPPEEAIREMMRAAMQAFLEEEMDETLGAGKGERVGAARAAYRSGYYSRGLVTRVGKLELRIPQERSEKALIGTLAEMYVQGVSTRKVKTITEELCGHEFSATSISRVTAKLDGELKRFFSRKIEEDFPFLILDARYEKVREDGVVRDQAVLIAIAVGWDGRRQVLSAEMASRESETSWRDFLVRLRDRGLRGVEFVVSDDHQGLKRAIREILPEAVWQRCYVHFLRNALDKLPRKADPDCLLELRWIYDRRTAEEARRDLAAWLQKWQTRYPKLCDWVEENIDETLSFYRLPQAHHKHMKSTNMLERFNEELKRRTRVVRIFPNVGSCLRLIRALAVETHEEWMEAPRYLNLDLLREHRKEEMLRVTQAA